MAEMRLEREIIHAREEYQCKSTHGYYYSQKKARIESEQQDGCWAELKYTEETPLLTWVMDSWDRSAAFGGTKSAEGRYLLTHIEVLVPQRDHGKIENFLSSLHVLFSQGEADFHHHVVARLVPKNVDGRRLVAEFLPDEAPW